MSDSLSQRDFNRDLQAAQAGLGRHSPTGAHDVAGVGDVHWVLNVGIPSGGQALTGLAPLDITIVRTGNGVAPACKLRIDFPDSGFAETDIPVQLQAGRAVCRFAIHTHLLDNGRSRFRVLLLNDAGIPVAARQDFIDIRNDGAIAVQVRDSLRAARVPLVLDGPCDAGLYDYADTALIPWFDRPDAEQTIHAWLVGRRITFAEAEALLGFVSNGYMVLPNLIEDELLGSINKEIDHVIATGHQGYEPGSGKRLEHLHTAFPGVRRLWMHPRILHFLDLIFAARARPCQSLTFICGSEQHVHQDTVHLTPFPAGYMCGVWIALEDVQPGSGELEVYPGSHRLPRIYMHDSGAAKVSAGDWTEFSEKIGTRWQELREQGRFESMVYRPARGTVLIWHENLMHAGGKRLDRSLSRRSIVTHNFAEGALVFYDSTGNIGYTFDRDN